MHTSTITTKYIRSRVDPNLVPEVTVIIIFLNAERFLQEAIESVLAQTLLDWELLLVDDGSTDLSTEIAWRYARNHPGKIHYLEHPQHQNRGMSASRNLGVRYARGEFVAFLDSDDVWLPRKLQEQSEILRSHPEAAMVYGVTQYWYSWTGRVEDAQRDFVPQLGVPLDNLIKPPRLALALLENQVANSTGSLARREAIQRVGGYEEDFRGMFEDQVLCSKISLKLPIFVSSRCWYKYRRHDRSCCSVNETAGKVIDERLVFLKWLESYIQKEGIDDHALQRTIRKERWKARNPRLSAFVNRLAYRGRMLKEGSKSRAKRLLPVSLYNRLRKNAEAEPPVGRVRFGDLRRLTPISRVFGFDRGTPVDRYYIENFLNRVASDIQGHVLEVGDDSYTRRFGKGRITRSDVLHVSKDNPHATIIADLTNAPQIPSNTFDCIVLTQTLQLIYDPRAALFTLHRILKPGGVLLVTIPGVSQIDHHEWHDSWYWGFTTLSARRLFEEVFPPELVEVESHGNVLAVTAFLQGIALEELSTNELDQLDPDYQLIITIRATKEAGI